MEEDNNEQPHKRKFLGIWFECCHVYGRLYPNKDGTKYIGRCPKCMRVLNVEIDANSAKATNRRFFRGR